MTALSHTNWRRFTPLIALAITGGAVAVFTLSSRVPAQVTATQTQSQIAENIPAPAPYISKKLCNLQDQNIDESSGVGASRRYPDLFWTHNDSGDSARLFLINKVGKTIITVNVKGAEAKDWEDMAVAGDPTNSMVYIGDIGDNAEVRENIVIYRFREPKIDLKNPPEQLSVGCEKMTLTYPDQPHNAETLMADLTGKLLIITKSVGQTFVYQTPDVFKDKTEQKLEKLGEIAMPAGLRNSMTTGGDISPDGSRLVVMTYGQMHEWNLGSWFKNGGAQWRQIMKNKPRTWDLPKAKQMEAVCYGLDNKLYSTSEQLPTPFFEYSPTN